MTRYFLLLLLPIFLCTAQAAAAQNAELARAYNESFVGKSRKLIVMYYGAPSRSVKIDDGVKILEYAARARLIDYRGKRTNERCTLRFWLSEDHVTYVDDIGDHPACVHFLKTRRRDADVDAREWLKPEYP
ncbi:MAG TPA: hypothetical protein VHB73_04610 [Alphaproteobacteria bacterium]|nr:hypothetical protein [Alphaproteobacteria bacterium]